LSSIDVRYLCVYCGSSPGVRPAYAEAARRVGLALGERGLGLVYGGGRRGLMGVVADAVLEAGGQVVGVIPDPLATVEQTHDGLTELHVVPGMHERKALMARLASGFLTLPGGIGTYEEFFETLTWAAIGLHAKPIGLLNVHGYFDPLLRLLEHAVAEQFVNPAHLDLLHVSSDPETLATDLLLTIP
jgi:uncharacterized protein (TIGR00730 family)